MKKLLLALALFLIPAAASAQCSGVFSAGNVCGSILGGPPGQVPGASVANPPYLDLRNFAVAPKTFTTVCNGSGDDTATIQAAANAAGSNSGGRIIFPAGTCRIFSPGIDFTNKFNIALQGQGAGSSPNVAVTNLVYTSATGSIFNLDGASGIEIYGMQISYNNASYAGDLIDARHLVGTILPSSIHIHDCSLSGVAGSAVSANSLIRFGGTLRVNIHDCFLQYAARAIENSGAEGAVNDIDIHDNWIQAISIQPITTAGNNWNVHDNAVEPLVSGGAGFIIGTATCYGCNIATNNIGDATTGNGTWIDLTGGAFVGGSISNNQIDETHQGTSSVSIKLGSSIGTMVTGNALFIPTGGTNPVTATSAANVTIISNNCYVTNSGTTPCGILNGSAPANSVWNNNDGVGFFMTGAALNLPTGFVLNWGTGDVTITEAANLLSFTGASVGGYTFDFTVYPATNRAGSLGTASNGWASLYLGGSSSGVGQLVAPAAAGAFVWTMPGATDTLVGRATTDTLTNKTFNCANNTCTVRIASDVSGLGTGVATALGNATNASGGLVGFNGVLGAATFTSLKAGGSAMTAPIDIDQSGGDVFAMRFSATNPRLVLGIGGSSGTPFMGANVIWSGSGNVWNFDRTGSAAIFGNLAGASDANYICGATGTAGASTGFDTNAGCGIAVTTTGELAFAGGGTPTISSGACGTGTNGSIAGTNQAGKITIGASATATCTVSFSRTLGRAPAACLITPANATAAAQSTTLANISSISTSAWVISGTLANANYYYHCI